MLTNLTNNQILIGVIQASIAAILSLGVITFAKTKQIDILKDSLIALLRSIIQIVLISLVLIFVFTGPLILAIPILAAMMYAAGTIAGRRAKGIPHAKTITFKAVAFGSGLVIITMTLLGVIEWDLKSIIPVGSMIIANSMNTSALSLERFKSQVLNHTGEIESGLALGASPNIVIRPHIRSAISAALIPRIDSLRSLGIVWIPGIMTGMILSGSDPIYAGIYQFVIMAMIFSSSALASIMAVTFIKKYVFSEFDQLIFKPGNNQKKSSSPQKNSA
ncbi:MAG: ABC transporter permease [Anaerolineaceae bacterium]|nr:ABC transporter permease [Anaerolineaceae bacterium]